MLRLFARFSPAKTIVRFLSRNKVLEHPYRRGGIIIMIKRDARKRQGRAEGSEGARKPGRLGTADPPDVRQQMKKRRRVRYEGARDDRPKAHAVRDHGGAALHGRVRLKSDYARLMGKRGGLLRAFLSSRRKFFDSDKGGGVTLLTGDLFAAEDARLLPGSSKEGTANRHRRLAPGIGRALCQDRTGRHAAPPPGKELRDRPL